MPRTQPAASGKLSDAQIRAALALIDPRWAQPGEARKGAKTPDVAALEKKLSDKNPVTRAEAAAALGQLKSKKSTGKLKDALADPFPPVRQAAASALLQLGDKAMLNEFVKALKDENPRVVAGAATALGESGNEDVVPYLIDAFRTTNPVIGSAIARALGALKAPQAVQWLTAALTNNFIPAAAAEALGRIGDPSAAPLLVHCLEHPDADVKAAAARSLGLFKGSAAKSFDQQTRDTKVLPALSKLSRDPSAKVRLCAAIARMELGDKDGAELLKKTLEEAAKTAAS